NLVAVHDFGGFRSPFFRAVHVHPVPFLDKFLFRFIGEKFQVSERGFAYTFPVVVADFVLQDSAEPTADCRSTTKTVMRAHSGKECLLNEVLCDVGLADTFERVAIKNVAMLIDPTRWIIRSRARLMPCLGSAKRTSSNSGL